MVPSHSCRLMMVRASLSGIGRTVAVPMSTEASSIRARA
jgi:hypothetical protein